MADFAAKEVAASTATAGSWHQQHAMENRKSKTLLRGAGKKEGFFAACFGDVWGALALRRTLAVVLWRKANCEMSRILR
ncbi:MAG TPA: hypothetical protein VGL97_23855 [Bryobacteraceae bacterium]